MVLVKKTRKITIKRSGPMAAILLFMSIAYTALGPAPVSAAAIQLNLNLGLPFLDPLTALTNPVTSQLPVSTTITTSPSQPIVSLSTPSSTPSTTPSSQNVVNPTPAHQNTQQATANTSRPIVSSHHSTPPAKAQHATANATPPGVKDFFQSTLPRVIRTFTSKIIEKPINAIPIIVSILLLLITIGMIGGITRASSNGGMLSLGRIGRIDLTRIIENHDVAQIASFLVATVCFGVVATCLTFASL